MGLFDDLPTARRGGLFDGLPNAESRVSTGLFDDIPADSRTPTRGLNRRGRRTEQTNEQRALRQKRMEEEQARSLPPPVRLSRRAQEAAAGFEQIAQAEETDAPLAYQLARGVGSLGEAAVQTYGWLRDLPVRARNALGEAAGVEIPESGRPDNAQRMNELALAMRQTKDELFPAPAAIVRQDVELGQQRNRGFMGQLAAYVNDPGDLVATPLRAAEMLTMSAPAVRVAGAVGGGAVLAGGSAGVDAGQQFDEELRAGIITRSPEFMQLADRYGEDAAVRMLRNDRINRVTEAAGAFGALAAGATSRLGLNPVDDLLAGRAAKTAGTARSALGSGAAEAAGEFGEEYGTQVATNVGARLTGSNVDLTEGAAEAGAGGLALGGITGAGVGALQAARDRAAIGDAFDISPETNAGLETLAARRARLTDTTRRIVEAAPTPAAVEGVDLAAQAFDRARSARRAEVRQPLPTAGAAIAPALPAGTQLRSPGRMQQLRIGAAQPTSPAETPITPPAIQPTAMQPQRSMDERRAELDQRLAQFRRQRAEQDAAEEGTPPVVDFYREPDNERIRKSSSDLIEFDWDTEDPPRAQTSPTVPEFAPSGRQYGQAPDDATPDWVMAEGRNLNVRKAEAGELADAFLEIAQARDQAFQLPQVPAEARTLEDIGAAVDPAMRIERMDINDIRGKYPKAREAYRISMRDGTAARFVVEEDGGTQLNAAALEEGKSGGAALYAAVNTFAQRNGLRALPDRDGLTEINKTRRTEQQAASGIRTGTAQHLVPDITQAVAGFEIGGDDRANIGALLMKGFSNTVNAMPEVHQLRYNFDSGQFEWTNGEKADDADFDRLAESDPAREAGIGRSTLKRAVLAASVLRETRRRGVGSGRVLGSLGRQQLQQLAAPALERIFYSRNRGGVAALPVSRTGTAPLRNSARTESSVWGELTEGLGRRMARRLRAQPWLKVVNTRAEVEERWRRQLTPSEMVGGFYAPNGDVYLIADEMREQQDDGAWVDVPATAIALHEIGVHYGLRGMLGGDFAGILADFEALAKTDARVKAAFDRVPAGTNPKDIAEEALAYFIQQNYDQKVGLVDRIMAAINRFLRRFGVERQLTPDQLLALARGAADRASRGQFREGYATRPDSAEGRERAAVEEALAFSRSDTTEGFAFQTARDGRMRVSGDLERARALIAEANIPVRGAIRRDARGEYLDISPTFSDAVRAALTGRESTASRAGVVYDHPKNASGEYIGAPPKYNTARRIGKLREQLKALALEGESGRFWYEESSEAILDFVGGNVEDADLLAKLLAIYSPQARVDSNTTLAIRAYYQLKAGVPVRVKTEVQDRKAQAAFNKAPLREWMGEKTNNFYLNLMTRIDPARVKDLQGATIDMWMMRAFEYPSDAPTATQYRFAEIETNRLARELGWEPQQVQAAVWVAMKARTENPEVKAKTEADSVAAGDLRYGERGVRVFAGADAEVRHAARWTANALAHEPTEADAKQAGFHFGDGLRANGGQLAWEATPSKSVTLLPWIHDNMEAKNELQARMAETIGDRILREFGVLAETSVFGYGGWQGAVSPSNQERVAVASEYREVPGKKTAKPRATEVAAARISAAAAVYGLLLKQDGVAWHRPFYSDTNAVSNGVHLDIGRPLTPDETQTLYDAVTSAIMAKGVSEDIAREVAPIPHETGVRFLNFGQLEKNDDLFKAVTQAARSLPEELTATALRFRSDGELVWNDWKENANGEGYRRRILEAGFGDQLGRLEAELGPAIEGVFREVERKYQGGEVKFSHSGRRRGDVGGPDAAGNRLGQALPQGGVAPPSFSARKPQKDAVTALAVHYSPVGGLNALDPTFAGTAFAGGERRRFGPGRFGLESPRLNFYVQEDGGPQPGKEQALASAKNGYSVRLTNLYDYAADPRGFVADTYPNADALEEEVADAGFDGILFDRVAGIPNRTAVLFGFKKKVPVAPVEDAGVFGEDRIRKSSSAAEQPRDDLGRFAEKSEGRAPRAKPDKRFSTSTKNEVMEEERALLAKDPVFSALPSRAHEDLVIEARQTLKRDPGAAEQLAYELSEGMVSTVSEEQEALLLVGKIELMKKRAEVARVAFDRRYSEERRNKARYDWDQIESRVTMLDVATKTTGAIWARTGLLRQRVLREDFTFDSMAEKLARAHGRPLTANEAEELTQMAAKIRSQEIALDEARQKLDEAADLAESQRMLTDMVTRATRYLRSETKARSRSLLDVMRQMADESRAALARMDARKIGVNRPSQRKQGGAVDVARIFHLTRIGAAELVEMGYTSATWSKAKYHEWRSRMRRALGPRKFAYSEDLMPGIAKQARADLDKINATKEERIRAALDVGEGGLTHADVYELIEALVDGGMRGETEIMEEATRLLQEAQPGIALREVRRLFTDYGRARFPSNDEVKRETRKLRELQRIQESIDRLEEGLPALKTGQQRDKTDAEIRERRKRLNELLRMEELKSAADPTRLATFQDARISNLKNLIADLKRMLETGERPIAIPSPPPTDEMVKLQAEVADLRKKIREQDRTGAASSRAAKRLLEREEMLARRLADLQKRMLTGEGPAKRAPKTDKSPIENQIAALQAQLRAIERAKKPRLSRAERINRARIRALEREEELLTEELLTTLRRPANEPVPPTAEVEAKAAAVAALRQQVRDLRASMVTPEQAEQAYQLGVSKLLARQIKVVEARLASGDYSPRKRADKPMLDAANRETQFQLRRLKHAFAVKVFEAELAKRTKFQKLVDGVIEGFNITRSIMTSIDWSAILRQSLFTFGHPIKAARIFGPMVKATFSAARNEDIEESIRRRPNYPLYEKAKLHITESHGFDPRRVEEQFTGRWLERMEEVEGQPVRNYARKAHRLATAPVRGSARAYSTFTNLMRVEMFDALHATLINDPTAPTQAELEAVANLVNVFTGRGTFGKKVDMGGTVMSLVLFAPRYLASRFNVLSLQPILRGAGASRRVAKLAAMEYARTLAGLGFVYAMAALYQAAMGDEDDEDDWFASLDPRSSDFGKVKFGNVYLDPMAGLAQVTTFLSRMLTRETVAGEEGEVRSLGPDRAYGQRGAFEVMADFARSKLSPGAGFVVNTISGEGFGGEVMTPADAAGELVMPLAWREVPNVIKERGLPEGMGLMALSWLGMGIQYRDPDRWEQIKQDREDYAMERAR